MPGRPSTDCKWAGAGVAGAANGGVNDSGGASDSGGITDSGGVDASAGVNDSGSVNDSGGADGVGSDLVSVRASTDLSCPTLLRFLSSSSASGCIWSPMLFRL